MLAVYRLKDPYAAKSDAADKGAFDARSVVN